MSLLAKLLASLSGQQTMAQVRRVPTPRGAVQRDPMSLVQQRGWRKNGTLYSGPFATSFGTWPGVIETAGDCFRVLIKNPPINIVEHHPKWTCFSRDKHGWWRINLSVNPVDRDVNAVILYVERLLIESFKRTQKA